MNACKKGVLSVKTLKRERKKKKRVINEHKLVVIRKKQLKKYYFLSHSFNTHSFLTVFNA